MAHWVWAWGMLAQYLGRAAMSLGEEMGTRAYVCLHTCIEHVLSCAWSVPSPSSCLCQAPPPSQTYALPCLPHSCRPFL